MNKKIINSSSPSKNNTMNRLFDVLFLFTSLFAIAMLLFVAYNSIQVFLDLFRNALNLESKMFYVGILIAITSGLMYFVEMFVIMFAKSYKNIFGKPKNE